MTAPKPKKATGRPRSQPDTLPAGWRDKVLELYADGASDVEVRVALMRMRGTMSNCLWERWMAEEPSFSETIKEGRRLAEAWWAQLGRDGAAGKREINPTVWIFNMKNRYRWADRSEVKSEVVVRDESVETLVGEAAALGVDPEVVFGRQRLN